MLNFVSLPKNTVNHLHPDKVPLMQETKKRLTTIKGIFAIFAVLIIVGSIACNFHSLQHTTTDYSVAQLGSVELQTAHPGDTDSHGNLCLDEQQASDVSLKLLKQGNVLATHFIKIGEQGVPYFLILSIFILFTLLRKGSSKLSPPPYHFLYPRNHTLFHQKTLLRP